MFDETFGVLVEIGSGVKSIKIKKKSKFLLVLGGTVCDG